MGENAIYEYVTNIGNVCLQPIIAVSDIINNAAKITFHLPTKRTCAQYQIRYKEFDKNDDDEKQNKEWNDIDYDDNEYPYITDDDDSDSSVTSNEYQNDDDDEHKEDDTEYILGNLQKNTKYEVCGRYKTKKENVWSAYSENVIFETLNNLYKYEWDIDCKGDGMKVNGQIVTGSDDKWESIWIKGIVSTGTKEWKFKIMNDGVVRIGITNEKNEKKKDSSLSTLCYYTCYGFLYDEDGNLTKTNEKAEKNDIVSMILDLNKNHLIFLLNGKQIGNPLTVKNGSYRAAVSLYKSRIELL